MINTVLDTAGMHVREIARNLERLESGGDLTRVCLDGPQHNSRSCACYRDAGHPGPHRCACGAEWGPGG